MIKRIDATEMVSKAVCQNRVDVLERFRATERQHLWIGERRYHLLEAAVEHDSDAVLKWLWEHEMISAEDYHNVNEPSLLVTAVCNNSLNVLKWLHNQGLVKWSSYHVEIEEILDQLTYRNNLFMLEWLHEQGVIGLKECQTNKYRMILSAALAGNVNVLNWIEKIVPITAEDCRARNCEILNKTAIHGMYESLVWLEKHGAGTPEDCQTLGMIQKSMYWNSLQAMASLSRLKCNHYYHCNYPASFDWIAERIDLACFKKHMSEEIWYNAWRRKVLLLVLAGRRQRRRQPPPELWGYAEQFC